MRRLKGWFVCIKPEGLVEHVAGMFGIVIKEGRGWAQISCQGRNRHMGKDWLIPLFKLTGKELSLSPREIWEGRMEELFILPDNEIDTVNTALSALKD